MTKGSPKSFKQCYMIKKLSDTCVCLPLMILCIANGLKVSFEGMYSSTIEIKKSNLFK